ncbi:hypothetical protein DND132_0902 [Pseudodesulfovibrio mercurii]|uniref:Uncharacterized protein n=1 Tax=Pseudodesulfovibrio mercurii TaxID=641491 RepID=F0JHY7_9BACT|nr:outer membrane homotrimeric porin [Pseudodesulfovibrio mercurii]EGB14117.1 hypothetical protein DND132_0902 [Pseudodesulfovibrio mercurii]
MKRLSLLAIALIMVLGMAASASAAPEVAISGNVLINAVWKNNWDFSKVADEKNMTIYQRADLYFTVTANENLKGVLGLRSNKDQWGGTETQLGNPGGNNGSNALYVRDAYIDFNWPGTDVNVKAGIQYLALPTAIGGSSWILGDRAGAVMVSAPVTDNVSVLAGYTRLFDTTGNSNVTDDGQVDAWLLALPLNFEGVSATPFFLYSNTGVNSVLGDATTYWAGTDFTMSLFDPFVIKADINYGNSDNDIDTADASGWLFDLGVDYTGFDFMTVSAYFVYTTGEDDDAANGSERMPILVNDWAVGSFFFGGGSITGDDMDSSELGFWTLGVSLTGIQSFAEGLTHDFHLLYVKGTNDKDSVVAGTTVDGRYLTEKDSLWEVDFNTAYAVYDELTLYGQLGYINSDFDKDIWADVDNDAWKVATGVVYKF